MSNRKQEPSLLLKGLVRKAHGNRKYNEEKFFTESKEKIPQKRRLKRKDTSLVKIMVLTVLISFPIIYLTIHGKTLYTYFTSENVSELSFKPIWRDIEDSERATITKKEETRTFPKTRSAYEKTAEKHVAASLPRNTQNTETLYSWVDENGLKNFSNLPPKKIGKNTKAVALGKKSVNYTKAYIEGNSVYVPVTISIKGKYRTEWMLLDTGCTHTSLPYKYLNNMNPSWRGKVSATVANGNTVTGYNVKLDTIKVGIKSKRNFIVSAYKRSGADNRGLLGMDFLKDNPFKIDFEAGKIIWL